MVELAEVPKVRIERCCLIDCEYTLTSPALEDLWEEDVMMVVVMAMMTIVLCNDQRNAQQGTSLIVMGWFGTPVVTKIKSETRSGDFRESKK